MDSGNCNIKANYISYEYSYYLIYGLLRYECLHECSYIDECIAFSYEYGMFMEDEALDV